ncbi:MAG: response regulator [Candidatus Aminicenantes bacterium]|nr:response regulator [Candidatus Aminicenantes bacterium]
MDYILIVEDEMIPGDSLKLRVEGIIAAFGMDCRVEIVETVEAARAALEQEHPVVILLDIMLPKREGEDIDWDAGIKFARDLLKTHPGIPIIVITGRGDDSAAEQARQLDNVKHFFRKPMPGLDFREALKGILEGKTDE